MQNTIGKWCFVSQRFLCGVIFKKLLKNKLNHNNKAPLHICFVIIKRGLNEMEHTLVLAFTFLF